MCNRTGSYKESRATLPADLEWRKANRGNGVKCIKGDTTWGPHSERPPEGRDMNPAEAEESSQRPGVWRRDLMRP